MTLNDDLILYLNTGISNGKCGIRKSTIKNTENNFGRCKAAITAYSEETKEQQDRLRHLITKIGGIPTREKRVDLT
jgi:hypothetical protein